MKKLFALLAVVLAVASCQKESNDLAVNIGEQETLITVALPEATRANSALSGLDNGVLADHDLRFILEIYSDGGNDCLRKEQIVADGDTSTSFNVRLVPGHAYEFVVWADFVKKGVDTYFDTTTNGLDAIEMLNLEAMTEARDAYYGVASIAEDGSVSEVSTIVLKRPFAKVRVVADDVEEAKEALQKGLTTATATYADGVIVYKNFNARTKSVSGKAAKVKNITYPSVYNESTYDESNLYVDYLLVPQDEPSVIKFDLNVDGFVNRSFKTDIAVEANKLTTIKGNILTNGSDITVDVNDDFASETIYLEGDVTLTENLVIDRPMVVRKGATAVLNLNGFNITNNTKNDVYGEDEAIIVYGNLTIKGNGTVTANSMAVWARGKGNNAVVNIEGGTYYGCAEGFAKSGRSVIYASGGNTINIYGGKFQALAEDTTSFTLMENGRGYAAVNVEDTNNNIISVYGGSFYKQNPADPRTENPARSFVAEGCVVTKDGDWYNVTGYTPVATAGELAKAAMFGGEITLTEDIVLDESLNVTANLVINLDGKTITGAFVKNDGALIKNNGILKIVGGTLKNTHINGDAVINNSGELVLDDVKIEGAPIGETGYPAYAVISSGKMIINDGTEVSADRGCLKLSNDGETVINGGTFVNNDIDDSRIITSHVVDVEDGGSNKLTINGGTFEHRDATTSGGVVICNRTTGTVYVNGGNFSGGDYYGNDNLSDYGYRGTFSVTGGTYTAEPATNYIADGYKVIEQDGKYVVVQE